MITFRKKCTIGLDSPHPLDRSVGHTWRFPSHPGRDAVLLSVILEYGLQLDVFRLLAMTEDDSELLMLVETTASVVGCSGYGTRARWRGRRRTRARDLPVGVGRRYWCGSIGCGAVPRRPAMSSLGRRPVPTFCRGRCCRSGPAVRQYGGSAGKTTSEAHGPVCTPRRLR